MLEPVMAWQQINRKKSQRPSGIPGHLNFEILRQLKLGITTPTCEAPRPQDGASRKGNLIYIVPLDPAYRAGLAGHLPVKDRFES